MGRGHRPSRKTFTEACSRPKAGTGYDAEEEDNAKRPQGGTGTKLSLTATAATTNRSHKPSHGESIPAVNPFLLVASAPTKDVPKKARVKGSKNTALASTTPADSASPTAASGATAGKVASGDLDGAASSDAATGADEAQLSLRPKKPQSAPKDNKKPKHKKPKDKEEAPKRGKRAGRSAPPAPPPAASNQALAAVEDGPGDKTDVNTQCRVGVRLVVGETGRVGVRLTVDKAGRVGVRLTVGGAGQVLSYGESPMAASSTAAAGVKAASGDLDGAASSDAGAPAHAAQLSSPTKAGPKDKKAKDKEPQEVPKRGDRAGRSAPPAPTPAASNHALAAVEDGLGNKDNADTHSAVADAGAGLAGEALGISGPGLAALGGQRAVGWPGPFRVGVRLVVSQAGQGRVGVRLMVPDLWFARFGDLDSAEWRYPDIRVPSKDPLVPAFSVFTGLPVPGGAKAGTADNAAPADQALACRTQGAADPTPVDENGPLRLAPADRRAAPLVIQGITAVTHTACKATKAAVGLAIFGARLACFGTCMTLVGGVVAIGMARHIAVVTCNKSKNAVHC